MIRGNVNAGKIQTMLIDRGCYPNIVIKELGTIKIGTLPVFAP